MATIVELIRQSLAKRDGISEEVLRPLAASYATEVTRVNNRLSAAVQLLHKGLRSEAIQSVSMNPNAIDDAAKLDLPEVEIEDWFDILQFLDIPVPPCVNRDLVDQLNEAIVETQPIESLLKRHRKLAIARAPLAWRLKVLRRIAEVDTGSSVWEDDIENWEKVRHKQIATEAPGLISTVDPESLRDLHNELTKTPWRIPPDTKIIKQVQSTLSRINDIKLLSQLESIATKLNDAFCEFDENAARQQLAIWNDLRAQLNSPLPENLAEQAEPTILWIQEVDRETNTRKQRAVAIGNLESALDRKVPLEDLEKAFQQTSFYDDPPPEELVQRFRVTVDERQLTKKRRFQAMISAILAMAIIAIAALTWWQLEAAQQKQISKAQTEFQSLLDSGNIDGATVFYSKLQEIDPKIAESSEIASIAGQLQAKINQNEERESQFQKYLAEADAELDSDIDLSALHRAEQLAQSDEEKGQVFVMRRRKTDWESAIASQQTEQLLTQLTAIRGRIETIERGEASEDAMLQLGIVLDELESLQASYPRATTSARNQISSVRPRVISMRNAIQKKIGRMEEENRLMSSVLNVKSLDQLAAELKRVATRLPDSPMAEEFKRVAEERRLWDTAFTWNEYVDAVAQTLQSTLSEKNVTQALNAKSVTKSQLDHSLMQLPAPALDRLERYSDRSKILENVLGGLPETVIADLITVIESNGTGDRHFIYKSYFERARQSRFGPFPDGPSKQRSIEVVINDSGAVKTKLLEGDYVVHKEPYATIQSLLVSYETQHDQLLADWDGEFLKLIATLRKRENLDSQIKEMLLQHLLSGACEGSEYLSNNLVNELRLLKERNVEITSWYEPTTQDSILAQPIEQSIIPRLASLYSTRPTPQNTISHIRNQQFQWVGILVRSSTGEITPKLLFPPTSDCNLAIVRPSQHDQTKVDWVPIGEVQSGQTRLSNTRSDRIAGRPIFSYPKQTHE
tara:strand:+ start:2522 stop:5428 length:2907 start_codon:yes stop_codon:yes gene_type:complete